MNRITTENNGKALKIELLDNSSIVMITMTSQDGLSMSMSVSRNQLAELSEELRDVIGSHAIG